MNEQKLRESIRKEIRKSLKEVDISQGVEQGADRLERFPGLTLLKQRLAQGSPRQRAAGLLKVINAISGEKGQAVKTALIQMLKPRDAFDSDVSEPEATQEASTPSRVDLRMGQFKDEFAKKMQGKSATQQMDLVTGLVADLDLKGNEAMFLQKLRKVLSKKK